ncbi:DUF1499 domain-containing protein [Qipengyuania sp. RANM35]|uniref:DUF1499 domain-containing protein n=1 Tax=Qipengyuania sp. RANM35 TaxID=3068635 RepID=UPI0034DB1EC4
MIAKLPRISLWLAVALVLWFLVAVFGPKFGLIDWKIGFLTMVVTIGPILMGIVGLVAIIALVMAFVKGPRSEWWKAAAALAIPVTLFAGLMSVRAQGDSVPPIHDVATDTANPPQFSPETMAMREKFGANPVDDYTTPIGQIALWADRVKGQPIAAKSHADIIADSYGDLVPVPYEGSDAEAMAAVAGAMEDIGLADVRRDDAAGTVEGTAETFAFGFKDDVVARVTEGRIDLRSVSRVGVSDLGYNAARVRKLAEAIEARLAK